MTLDTGPGTPGHQVDLTNCDREPIHLLGRVQSYGALIAVSTDWIVQHASANLGAVLGTEVEDAIGRPLSDLIVADAFQRIRKSMSHSELSEASVRLFGILLRGSGALFDISLHQSGRHLVLEFEQKADPSRSDVMSEVYPYIRRLNSARDLTTLAREAARGLAALSGFDSVMVYQFQPDHSGRVIAETRSDRRRVYHGLNFPASDIPVQARALYKRSLLRLIADINDPGSPVLPAPQPGRPPLDLSLAVTRSVSPIHIEYLGNMGVEASMSVSIMKDGELWGLFACHHNTPRYIDYERRTAIEMFGHLFSYELTRFEEAERTKAEQDTANLQTLLMSKMADGQPLEDSLLAVSEDIERVIAHDGLIICIDGHYHSIGSVPTEDEFRSIALMFDRSIGSQVFATDNLARLHAPARDYVDRCAGILAIPISRMPRDYIVLCRRQLTTQVAWAGDPSKPVNVGPNGTRLTPRRSFEIWRETVEGRSAPWSLHAHHAAELIRTVLLEIFLKVTDAANAERQRAQEQQQLLISELNHRVRNILNLMRGLLAQTRQSARTLEQFTDSLDGRIQSLARAHDQLTNQKWEPSSLRALIETEFEAYANGKATRVEITGPDAMISPRAYTNLALVLHEMATNSVKYGALCDQSGTVHITLTEDAMGAIVIDWIERGGPPVTSPKRRGFGTTIIETSIPHELKGQSEIAYKITGVEAHFRIPAFHIADVIRAPAPGLAKPMHDGAAQGTDGAAFRLSGEGLVLEDTLIIALDAAGIMEDLGARDVRISSSVEDALAEIARGAPDFALLDVNLGDEQSLPVAQRLAEIGVPFILATGYGDNEDIKQTYPPCIVVQKPFSTETLRDAFQRVMSGNVGD